MDNGEVNSQSLFFAMFLSLWANFLTIVLSQLSELCLNKPGSS